MKKKILMFILFILLTFNTKQVFAYSSDDYRYRNLCGNFEVAAFHSDGEIIQLSCHNTYQDAYNTMKNRNANDVAIFTKVNGQTKIIDANVALLDLSVNPETLTYFYKNNQLTGSAYTYMDTGSLYGGVDGAHMETSYSNARGVWTAKVRIGNFTGWISQEAYEIVPIPWVKSMSSYTVTNESIRHNYVAKIQNYYSGSAGSTIGPRPSMLQPGTYYSYDGHYFYQNMETLIRDYKQNNYNNSVNKNNAYYNYYMYLSNHTKTTYSSINIDEYIRNNLGKDRDVFGSSASNGTSRLYGSGTYFYYAQQKYGVNAILSLSLSRNETGNGTSNLAINKNNGFGLNAVDSNPYEAANWYANFATSILGYASKWITNGYAHPRDWRYFGPQFGDKFIGMNVKYAADTYWSEKMAANYYSFDRAKGLQDYNYYQLGVVNRQAQTYSAPRRSAKKVYLYPEAEDGLVIVSSTTGETVEGNNTWYEVISDLNIDSNYNEKSGDYNWNGTVYIPAAYVKKINDGKNGYVSPSTVTDYQDSNYSYNLLVENTVFKPRVGISKKETQFYYDSSLTSPKGQVLKNNRYVIIYSIAYDEYGNVKSYLVTSDYKYQQKHWVSADSINVIKKTYGKSSVTAPGNQYTWVNSIPEDTARTLISGLYTNAYVPILEQKTVDGYLWYKVPVDISGTTNEFGWTLASAPYVRIDIMESVAENNNPVIVADNKQIVQGTKFDALKDVTANDVEDGNITNKVQITANNINTDKVGTYEVTYQVTDNSNATTTKTIKVTVIANEKPTITAEDITIKQGEDYKESYKALDKEDGDLTSKVKKTKDTVNKNQAGTYEITYEVTDSYNQKTTKTIKVVVLKDNSPVINAIDKTITQGTEFKPLEGVTATDVEDGDITKKVQVIENKINNKVLGKYTITYQVSDNYGNVTKKTITIEVVKNQKPIINASDLTLYLNDEFKEKDNVTVMDPEDGNITSKLKVVKNTVDTSKLGEYIVIYEATDSYGNKTTKEINVEVIQQKLEEVSGTFYMKHLKSSNGILKLQAYQTILGIDNNLDIDITYQIVFENIDNGTEKVIKATRIEEEKNIPKKVYSKDGKDYTYSWFNANIDIEDLEVGNYKMHIIAKTKDKYSKSVIVNKTYSPQETYIKTSNKNAIINNTYANSDSYIEIKIRKENLVEKTSSYIYNQYDKYTKFEFTNDNKLHLRGNTYSYGMDLSPNAKVERTIFFENKDTYKIYKKNLGSITEGNYTVVLPVNDNLDKTRAWYDAQLDISDIPEGTYIIYIATKSNINDIFELTEKLGRSLDNVSTIINNKKYKFNINKDRGNRIELIVTK